MLSNATLLIMNHPRNLYWETERERMSAEGEGGVGRTVPVIITPLQHIVYPTTHMAK